MGRVRVAFCNAATSTLPRCHDNVRRERDQFLSILPKTVGIASRPANVNLQITANGPTQWRQPLQQCTHARLISEIICRCGQENADAPHPLRPLRPCRERPRGRRAAEKGDERAPVHCQDPPSRASDRKDSTPRYAKETAALRDFDPAYDRSGSWLRENRAKSA